MATIGQSAQDLWKQVAKPLNDTAGQINQAVGGMVGSAMGKAPPVQGTATSLPPPATPKIAPSVNIMPNFQGVKTPATTQKPIDSSWIGDGLSQNAPQAPVTPEIQSGASSDVAPKPNPTEMPLNGTESTPVDTSIPPTTQSMDDLYKQRSQIAGQESQTAQLALKQQQEQEKLAREARDMGMAQTQLNQQRDQAEKDAQASWQIKNMQAKDNLEKYARQLDQTVNRQGMNSLAISDARKSMETQNLIYQKMVSDNTQDTKNMMRSFEKAQADIDQRMIDTVGAINKDAYAQVIAGLTVDDSPASIQKLSELMQKTNAIKTQELAKYAMAKDAVTQQYAQQYEAFKQEQAQTQAMNKPDDKLSKLSGVMMNASGQPILGENGQPIPIPKELDKTISDDEGNVYAIYKDGTSAPIMGAKEKATAQNLQPIDVGGKVMLYNPRTGTMQEIDKTMSQKDIADLGIKREELQFKREDSAQDRQLKMQQQQQEFGINKAKLQIDASRLDLDRAKFTYQKGADGGLEKVNKATGEREPVTPAEAVSQNNIGTLQGGKYPMKGLDDKGRLTFDLSKAPLRASAGDVNATQCGRFVNELTGRAYGFGDSIKQKESLITQKDRMQPTIGSAFVKRYASTGHVGIVSGVERDANGDLKGIYVTDRNADGKGTIRQNTFVSIDSPFFKQISGYVENKKGLPPGYDKYARALINNPSTQAPKGMDKQQAMAVAEDIENKWNDKLTQVPGLDLELGGQIAEMTPARQASWKEQMAKTIEAKDPYALKRSLVDLMKTKMTSEERTDLKIEQESTNSMKRAKTELEKLIQSGQETGPLRKKLQKGIMNLTGTDYKPDLTSVEGRILDGLQQYRSKITGAAWGPQEDAEYSQMFGNGAMDEQTLLQRIDQFLQRSEERSLDRFATQYGEVGQGIKTWAQSLKEQEQKDTQEQKDLELQEHIYNRGNQGLATVVGMNDKKTQKVVDQAINDEATASELLYGQ